MKPCFLTLIMAFAMPSVLKTMAQSNGNIQHTKADTLNYEEEFAKNMAQYGRVTWGIKGGYTQAKLRGNEIDFIYSDNQTLWQPGFHLGIALNSQTSKYIWLKHELLFNVRGAKVPLSDSVHGEYSAALKSYYVDLLPLNITFHYKGLQLFAGPYISALVAATQQLKNQEGSLEKSTEIYGSAGNFEDKNKYLQKFDVGVNIGLEYMASFGLALGARYMHGITDIFQFANSYTLESPKVTPIKIHNQCFMISLGYYFNAKP